MHSFVMVLHKAIGEAESDWGKAKRRSGGPPAGVQARDYIETLKDLQLMQKEHPNLYRKNWTDAGVIDTKKRVVPLPPLDDDNVFPFLMAVWENDPRGKQSLCFGFLMRTHHEDTTSLVSSSIHYDSPNLSQDSANNWQFPHVQIGNRSTPQIKRLGVQYAAWPLKELPRIYLGPDHDLIHLVMIGLYSIYGKRLKRWNLHQIGSKVKPAARAIIEGVI